MLPSGADRVKSPMPEVFVKLTLYVNGVDSLLDSYVRIQDVMGRDNSPIKCRVFQTIRIDRGIILRCLEIKIVVLHRPVTNPRLLVPGYGIERTPVHGG